MEDPHRPRPLDRIGDRPILVPAIGPKIGDRSIPTNHHHLISYSVLVHIVYSIDMYIDFLHYFLFVFLYFIVALLEELRSEEFHCHFYTVALCI